MADKLSVDISVNSQQADAALQQTTANVGKLSNKLDELNGATGGVGGANSGIGQMTSQVTTLGNTGSEGLGKLTKAFAAVSVAAVAASIAINKIKQATDAVIALGKLGGESLTVKASFEQMTASVGVSTNELREMQQASDGTISTLKLLELANYSMIGVTGEVGNAIGSANDQLIEIARAAFKARPSLQSVEFAYQSLVDGIKRVEKRLVDNLGLQVKAREANEKYAASVGKTVDELTAEEVQLAFLNEVLRAGGTLIQQVGGDVATMNDAFSRSEASATNLKVALGEELAPAVTKAADAWANFLTVLTSGLTDAPEDELAVLRNTLQTLEEQHEQLKAQMADDTFFGKVMSAWGEFAGTLDLSEDEIQKVKDAIAALESEIDASRFASENAARVAREYAEDTSLLDAAIRAVTQSMFGYIDAVQTLYDAEMKIIGKAQEAFDKSLTSTVRSIASLGGSFIEASAAGNEYASQIAQLEFLHEKEIITDEQYAYQLGVIDKKINDLKGTYKETTAAAKEFHDEFLSTIESLVSSNLSPSFDVAGLAPELSVREDEVDEHYRRLAAIAIRGQEEIDKHQADWADTLGLIPEDVKAKGIGAIQAWAAETVRAYDKGLNFDFINRDALKKRIMEALLAQEMKDQLVSEITAELGGAVSEAQVEAAAAAALGGTPLGQISLGGVTFGPAAEPPDMSAAAGQISTELNRAFQDKVDGQGMLEMTARSIIGADMKAVYAAGQVVGTRTLTGISDAVANGAPDIIGRLAHAIAPSVAAILANNTRRTG